MLNISNVLIKLNCTILFYPIFQILSGRWPNGWAPLLGRGVRSSNLHCLIPIEFLIIILNIMVVMEIRHSNITLLYLGSNLHCLIYAYIICIYIMN